MDAPDAETAQCMHWESQGLIASEVVEVDLSDVEAFLGRIQNPLAGRACFERYGRRPPCDPFHRHRRSTEMTARLGDPMRLNASARMALSFVLVWGGDQDGRSGTRVMA